MCNYWIGVRKTTGTHRVSRRRQCQLHLTVAVLPAQLTPLLPLLGYPSARLLQRAACSSPTRAVLKGPMLTQLLSQYEVLCES